MLTPFGKAMRKLRIEHDECIKDIATKLNVTVSYISAVEHGKREIPATWLDFYRKEYQLSHNEFMQIQQLAYSDKNSITIKFNEEDRELVLAFARELMSLTVKQKEDLESLLKQNVLT